MVVNGHGGNVPTLKAAAAEVAYENEGARITIRNWYDSAEVAKLVDGYFGAEEGSHVTPSEVSILMYLRPELVGDVARVKPTEAGLITWQPGPADLRQYYPEGVIGSDPSRASAEIGAELFEAAVEGVIEVASK